MLFHYAILLVLAKYSFRQKIGKLGQYLGRKRFVKWLGKFFYNMSECVFCCNHWGGAILVPLWVVLIGFEWEYLLFPLMSTGAIFLLDKQVD